MPLSFIYICCKFILLKILSLGIEGTTSNTPGTDPVYEVIVDEDAVSPVPNGHTYENQTPSGRSRPFNGQGSITGEISVSFIKKIVVRCKILSLILFSQSSL